MKRVILENNRAAPNALMTLMPMVRDIIEIGRYAYLNGRLHYSVVGAATTMQCSVPGYPRKEATEKSQIRNVLYVRKVGANCVFSRRSCKDIKRLNMGCHPWHCHFPTSNSEGEHSSGQEITKKAWK